MKAKPRTTYVLASPQTWELARAAYLAGMSGPTVAARFGLGVSALRKRAQREGWTKRDYAQALGAAGGEGQAGQGLRASARAGAHAPPLSREPAYARARPAAREGDGSDFAGAEDPMDAALPPIRFQPAALARRALAKAAQALEAGRPLEAREHARASEAILRLDGLIPPLDEIETVETAQWRHSAVKHAIWEAAQEIAEALIAGEPVPRDYGEAAAAWRRARGQTRGRGEPPGLGEA